MALAGMMINGVYMGEDAAVLAREILTKKTRPVDLGFKIQERGDVIFSKTQLQKWHLKVLPEYQNEVIFVE